MAAALLPLAGPERAFLPETPPAGPELCGNGRLCCTMAVSLFFFADTEGCGTWYQDYADARQSARRGRNCNRVVALAARVDRAGGRFKAAGGQRRSIALPRAARPTLGPPPGCPSPRRRCPSPQGRGRTGGTVAPGGPRFPAAEIPVEAGDPAGRPTPPASTPPRRGHRPTPMPPLGSAAGPLEIHHPGRETRALKSR